MSPAPALPWGRVEVAGRAQPCLFDGDHARLLDRPAFDDRAAETAAVPLAQARVLAPVEPGKVVAVGLNYRAHADELAMDVKSEPIIFLKPATSVIGPGTPIVCPPRSEQVDYEAELGLVVGRRCRDLTPATAPGAVAGYTCGNDVTARDLQRLDGQWTRAKSFDTFCPLGPWVVPDAPSPTARVSAAVEGKVVQHGLVGDMIVAPLELLVFVSSIMTLEPGDVLLTGTPPGVGPLAPGQTVTVEVEGVGRLTNPVERG
ncbi:MAG TPA: fumarylacetoacetate hydrolase family protein [Thermoleophilia bacterium]|nr:fumarylacetoacetate hydrolase family protein [Thermoleophilia bacterium]